MNANTELKALAAAYQKCADELAEAQKALAGATSRAAAAGKSLATAADQLGATGRLIIVEPADEEKNGFGLIVDSDWDTSQAYPVITQVEIF